MGKTKHKYREDDDDGVVGKKPSSNRHREKRLDKALRTKNVDELMQLDDDFNDDEPEVSLVDRMRHYEAEDDWNAEPLEDL